VTEAIRRIQQAGALSVRIEKRGDQEVTIISFRRKVADTSPGTYQLLCQKHGYFIMEKAFDRWWKSFRD
jgi:hypothetical protein